MNLYLMILLSQLYSYLFQHLFILISPNLFFQYGMSSLSHFPIKHPEMIEHISLNHNECYFNHFNNPRQYLSPIQFCLNLKMVVY